MLCMHAVLGADEEQEQALPSPAWAAQSNTGLLIKLTPKGVDYSFLFVFFPFLSFPFLSFPFFPCLFVSYPVQ